MKFIPVAQPKIGKSEQLFVSQCLSSSWISSTGKFIAEFEKKFARFCGSSYAVSCNNGTTALHLALAALDIKSGDEVLVPALTFVATANAVKYCGATPVFVDIDRQSWNIDPLLVEKKINQRTKAIIPVHLYGYPVNMKAIMHIARKYNLYIIEDAAEAHGAKYYNKMVGTFGNIGCFSFYGNKIITTGEGGMCVTDNKDLAKKMVLLKNHGMSPKRKYFHPLMGFNYRMTNIQAAIGLAQIKQIYRFIKRRQVISDTYKDYLEKLPQITFQPENPNIESVCWLFSCLIKSSGKKNRENLIKYLKAHQIDSRPFFYPIPSFPMYSHNGTYLLADEVSRQGINLPTYADLSNAQIKYICQTVKNFFS